MPEPAAHLFIFYFALLSEVTPPTALSCLAVSAVTGGDPYRTMWITWRYALPAFVVPFLFALPGGMACCWWAPGRRCVLATATAVAGIAALVGGVAGWWGAALAGLARADGGGRACCCSPPIPAPDAVGALLAGAVRALAAAGRRRSSCRPRRATP